MLRLALLTVLLLALGVGGLAYADFRASDRLAAGTQVAGVDVGSLTREQALDRLRRQVGDRLSRPAQVRVGDRSFSLSAEQAGVKADLRAAVERAYDAGRGGNVATRGWRQLTGGRLVHDEAAPIAADRRAVRRFGGDIQRRLARRAVDARLSMTVDSVSVTPERSGIELTGRKQLENRLLRAMSSPTADRVLHARLVDIPARVTAESVFDATPVAVTVSRSERRVRVFRRGELVKSYRVAVGQPKYPTPTGTFAVQVKQKDPVWNVPQAEWAGDLAGKTIPSGDPRNPLLARWIAFAGSVGFHGTKSVDSIGTAASHGCIRMTKADVIDLYERVAVGTPVLVA